MLEKLAESKALRERDFVVADRRRLAIMVKRCVARAFLGRNTEHVEVQKTRVARSREESELRDQDQCSHFWRINSYIEAKWKAAIS